MSSESAVLNLLQGVQDIDDRLYSALLLLAQDFYALQDQVNPPVGIKTFNPTGQLTTPGQINGLTLTVFTNNVRLMWNPVSGASAYEVRYVIGAIHDWNNGSVILQTTTLLADINPLTIPLTYGTYTFMLKSLDSNGLYSSDVTTVQLVVPTITTPVLSVTVIGNNVLLNWTTPISLFTIAFYNIYRDGSLIGNSSGTFEAIFETTGGNYTYTVQAVDIVGNRSAQSSNLAVNVGNPTDFVLHDDTDSNFSGIKVNCIGLTSLL